MSYADIRVGLLAYGAIGHEHNEAVQTTSGLRLMAVCDINHDRIAAALRLTLERGIHVVLEKPMALSSTRFTRIPRGELRPASNAGAAGQPGPKRCSRHGEPDPRR